MACAALQEFSKLFFGHQDRHQFALSKFGCCQVAKLRLTSERYGHKESRPDCSDGFCRVALTCRFAVALLSLSVFFQLRKSQCSLVFPLQSDGEVIAVNANLFGCVRCAR